MTAVRSMQTGSCRKAARVCALCLATAAAARAEELRVANVKAAPRDAKSATVTFDISWKGSWRHGVFHDAAWVFFKARGRHDTEWRHARLAADRVLNPEGYGGAEGTKLEFVVPQDRVGMIVRRGEDGVGTARARGVTVLCEAQSPNTELRAFGVEMVYVPEGPFYLGKGNEQPAAFAGKGFGGMELNWFYRFTRSDGRDYTPSFPYTAEWQVLHWAVGFTPEALPPYQVTGPDAIPTGRQKGKLWAVGLKPQDNGEIPAEFPEGFRAFYGMKRIVMTSGQYADFLNTLTAEQARPRYCPGGHGTAIERSGKRPDYTYSAKDPDSLCPWLSWTDGAAYAAWAGLRPMTELEYEKACRGPKIPIPNDAEISFWGMHDQGTLLYERTVSVADEAGRAFRGTHGSGTPEPPEDWPARPRDFETSGAVPGVIYRGDYFGPSHVPTYLLTGGRADAVVARSDRSASPLAGWRAARSAPEGDTAMRPMNRPLNTETVPLARMKQPMRADGVLNEWGEPTVVVADAALLYPAHFRFPSIYCDDPWRGTADMSARVYLGWDGEALCVAAEVSDDRQFNAQSGKTLFDGDALQLGLVNASGAQWNLGLALTEEDGVRFHQWVGRDNSLQRSAGYAVARDDEARVTRYELRLPLADLDLAPGDECSYYMMFFDDDDGNGNRYRFQLAPIVTYPFKRELFPRVSLEE